MISVYSVLYTLVLLSELSSRSVAAAMPAIKAEDDIAEQDGLNVVLAERPLSSRRSAMDDNVKGDDGRPKIFIISDMRLKGHSSRARNPVFTRSLSPITDQGLSLDQAGDNFNIDRRETDLDMLRCMIGRVYRPCWEA